MPKLSWPWKRAALPEALLAALQSDEQIQVTARYVGEADGAVGANLLAVSRFGLWVVAGDAARRWDWSLVSRARLSARTLTVVIADEVGVAPDGVVLLSDRPPAEFVLVEPSGLTDAVHSRVRRSVAASRHLPWPGAGGWVVLRRVPGRDGLMTQLRLDPAADVNAPGFLEAAALTAGDLQEELRGT